MKPKIIPPGKFTNGGLYLLSIFVGVCAAMVCIPFRYMVNQVSNLRPYLFGKEAEIFGIKSPLLEHLAVFLSTYLILLFVALLVKYFPKISGSGLPQTQALLYGRVVYNKPFTYLLVKFTGGVLSLGSGLSLGREGTSVQMGSLTGYLTGSLFRVKQGKRRHLIAAGAGAGISAAFTAPLSSSILILESLQKFWLPQTSICTLLAGASAGILAKLAIPYNVYDKIAITPPRLPEERLLLLYLGMAVFFAFAGKLFSVMLLKGKTWYARLDNWKYARYSQSIYAKVALLTTVTFAIGLIFPTIIGGDQTFLVNHANGGHSGILLLTALILVISAFTILSNSSGYPGGIFLPMMTVGGLAGKLFFELLPIAGVGMEEIADASGYFTIIGMSAFFISVVRTPLTGFILISEMTGHYEAFFPTLIVGILVYYFTQLLKVEPMNELLYKFMIENTPDESPRTTLYLDVAPNSYFDGKTPQTLRLPEDCLVTHVIRTRKAFQKPPQTPFDEQNPLRPGDQVAVEINSCDIEKLYQPLVVLSTS